MKYRGVIFDLDGTLANTIEDIGDSVNMVLRENNRETYNYDEYKQMVGSGFRNLIINAFKSDEDEEIDSYVKRFGEVYKDTYLNKTKEYAGITKMLNTLEELDVKIGINTNKRESYTFKIVEKLFPDIEFIRILGQVDNRPIKPNPMAVEMIISDMKLDKEEILYVGDSDVDMMTGENAGVDTIGVTWGFRSEEELRKNGASYIVKAPEEIIDIVKGTN